MTSYSVLFIVLILAATPIFAAPSPQPPKPTTGPVWPLSWNSTWYFVYTNNGSSIDGGNWWYEASSMPGYLRMDNNRCAHNIQPAGVSCSAIFRDNHLYWNMPQLKTCCTCATDLAITGPDWIINSTYDGVSIYNITNTWSYLWTRPAPFAWPYYETIPIPQNGNQRLPEANRGEGTDLGWENWKLGEQDLSVFDLPAYSCASDCDPKKFPGCGMTEALPAQGPLRFILSALVGRK